MLEQNIEVGKKYLTREGKIVLVTTKTMHLVSQDNSTYYVTYNPLDCHITKGHVSPYSVYGDGKNRGSAHRDGLKREQDLVEEYFLYVQEQLELF